MIQNVKLQLKGNDWIMPTPDFPKTSWYNEVLFGQLASHSSGSRKESGARRGGEGLAQSSRWTPAKPAPGACLGDMEFTASARGWQPRV